MSCRVLKSGTISKLNQSHSPRGTWIQTASRHPTANHVRRKDHNNEREHENTRDIE
jgi:hypothetical protein